MSPHLSAFQVSADAEELYGRILRSKPSVLAPYAAELGWTLSLTQEALVSLIAARLVRETADGLVLVEHPRTALERLVGNEEAKLDLRRRELVDARAAIPRFTSEHRAAGFPGGWPVTQPAWESVSSQMASSVVENALRHTSGVIRTCIRSLSAAATLDAEAARAGQASLAGGREQRAIYPISALEDPVSRRWARSRADLGEQQRVSERPPTEFAVFGDEVVLAVAEWRSTESDYIIIRNPMLIAAFTAMFDYAWELALPMSGVELDVDEDRQLLTLLANGFKDEAIARYLDLGVRTVRRRVASLMDQLGAENRFQLGAAAQRRGLLKSARR